MPNLLPYSQSMVQAHCCNFTPATHRAGAEIFGQLMNLSNDPTKLQNMLHSMPDTIKNEMMKNDNEIRNKEQNSSHDLMFSAQLKDVHKHLSKRSISKDEKINQADTQDKAKPGFALLANLRNTRTTANEQDEYGFTALMAITQDNPSIYNLMQSILTEKNPDINLRNYLGNTALHHAIISEAPNIAKLYADYGADVNAANMFGQTPYMLAMKHGYKPLMETLLRKGAESKVVKPITSELLISITEYDDVASRFLINRNNDINVADINGRTPLMHAIILNRYDLFERLIQKGADLELRDKNGLTALLIAAELGRTRMAHFLVEKKADLDAADNSGATALMHAVKKGSTKITEMLITLNSDRLNLVDHKGHNVLWYAIERKAPDTVVLLLAHNVNVNLRDPDGETPLMYAAEFDNVAVCSHLLEKMMKNGGSVDDVDVLGRTALMKAVSHNNTKVVAYLIKRQANFDLQDRQGYTAVNFAVMHDRVVALEYLLAAKANLDIADDDLDTPLLTAVKYNHSHLSEMLINAGASLDIRGVDNETALMHALKKNIHPIAILLLDKQAAVNIHNNYGETPFMMAVENCHLDICKKILQRGIDPNAACYNGTTALMLANKLGDCDKISWLQGITAGNDLRPGTIMSVVTDFQPSVVVQHPVGATQQPAGATNQPVGATQQPAGATKQLIGATKQPVGGASLRLHHDAVSGAMPRLFFLDNYRPVMMNIISSAGRGLRSLPGIFKRG